MLGTTKRHLDVACGLLLAIAVSPAQAAKLLDAAQRGHLREPRELLAAGADVDAAGGVAPLHEASLVADAKLIGALLDAGAVVDRALPEGETPLMLAARTKALRHIAMPDRTPIANLVAGIGEVAGLDLGALEHATGAVAL